MCKNKYYLYNCTLYYMTSTVQESWSLNYEWVRSQTHVSTRVLIESSHYLAVTSIFNVSHPDVFF